MTLKAFLILAQVIFLFFSPGAIAQDNNYNIGVFFWHESNNDYMAFEGIKEGFKATGLSIHYDIQKALGDEKKASKIINDWVVNKPDLIYAMGTGASKRLMAKIKDTPIIFTAVTNPVQSGITPDWKSSGRNLTGNSNWIETQYILSSFKEVVTSMKKLGIIYDIKNPVSSSEVIIAKQVISKLDLNLEIIIINSTAELDQAVKKLIEKQIDALWVPIDIFVYKNIKQIRKLTDPHGLPLLSSSHRGINDGAIFGIIVDYKKMGKRSVPLALKVMTQGIHPKDIPITTMRLKKSIVNLKVAKEIGFEIPMAVLATADEIIQ